MATVSCNKQNFQNLLKQGRLHDWFTPNCPLCSTLLLNPSFFFPFLFILVHKHRYMSGIKWLESSLQQNSKNCLTEHGLVNHMIQS